MTATATAVALGVVLTACGGGGDAEPTATSEPPEAKPTIEATAVPTQPGTPIAQFPDETPPPNTDMSSPRVRSTPEMVVGTPAAGNLVSATPAVTSGQAGQMNTPSSVPVQATTQPQDGSSGSVASDGTSGASLRPAASESTPDTMVVSTPAAATPAANQATPRASTTVPVVTSCDVTDIPPFTGDVTTYTLTVDLNFRDGPGADCNQIGDGPLGEFSQVEVIGGPVERQGDESGEWVEVRVGDRTGWLAFQFLEPVE